MGLVDDVYARLESEAIAGSSTDWSLFRRRLNDSAQQQVVLTEDGGFEPETWSAEGIGDSALEEPAIQVRVRGNPWDRDGAYAKAMEVMRSLHSILRETVGETIYLRIKAQTSEPVFIGFDEKGRPGFTQSFRAVRPVAATSS